MALLVIQKRRQLRVEGVQQVVEIDVGLPASLLVVLCGCGQYPLCLLGREFVQCHLGDVDGDQRES